MKRRFYISDLHLGHESAYNGKWGDDSRPFSCAAEADVHMMQEWNKVVRPTDTVYVLGDVALNKHSMAILDAMVGRKVLIKGNHDTDKLGKYTKHFADIRGAYQYAGMILTHIPIHPSCVERWTANVHGHLHSKVIDHPQYFNVSVEQLNYTPIEHTELVNRIRQNMGVY